eukprot:5423161-Heterocapsa_arctica.AAC.1
MPAILITGEVNKDVVVALIPGILAPPPVDLGFIPNQVVFGAAFPRLSSPGSQAWFLGECPDLGRPHRGFVANRAV